MSEAFEFTERARAERLEFIRSELVSRLRPVCTAWPDHLFDEMVESMSAIQLKFELERRSTA